MLKNNNKNSKFEFKLGETVTDGVVTGRVMFEYPDRRRVTIDTGTSHRDADYDKLTRV